MINNISAESQFSKPFIDSCILIYFFENNKNYSEISTYIIFHFGPIVYTSVISISEVLSKTVLSDEDIKVINKFFLYHNSMIMNVIDKDIAIKSAELRRKYGLKSPDAIQLASAINSECDCFITNDKRLKKIKEIKVVTLDEISI